MVDQLSTYIYLWGINDGAKDVSERTLFFIFKTASKCSNVKKTHN